MHSIKRKKTTTTTTNEETTTPPPSALLISLLSSAALLDVSLRLLKAIGKTNFVMGVDSLYSLIYSRS